AHSEQGGAVGERDAHVLHRDLMLALRQPRRGAQVAEVGHEAEGSGWGGIARGHAESAAARDEAPDAPRGTGAAVERGQRRRWRDEWPLEEHSLAVSARK